MGSLLPYPCPEDLKLILDTKYWQNPSIFEFLAFEIEESSVYIHDLHYFRRNQNFHDILRGLNLGQQGVFDISNQFHHLFWFGDLNYRVHTLQIEVGS